MKMLPRYSRGGFTLIEMIISLSIFPLLTAAVFGIFSATMEGVSALQDDDNRGDQADALGGWLKQSFLSLPADGSLISYHREGVPFDVSDVVWGDGDQLSALDLHLQLDGRYTLRLAVSASGTTDLTTFARAVLQDDPALSWRPLLRDLAAADWRFRTQGSLLLTDAAVGDRPDLVQFTFQSAGAAHAVVDDCWVPRVVPAIAPTLAAPANVTSNQ